MAIDVAKLKAAAAGSEQDKVNWYADRIQEGMTDAQIAAAVDKALGTKYSTSGATDPDWNYLQSKAAEQVVKETSKSSVKDKATAYNQLYQGAGLTNDEIQQAIVNAAGKQDPNDIRALLGIAGAQRASALPSGADKATYVKQMLGYGYTPDEIANYINTGVGQQSDANMKALFGLANVNLPTYLQPKADTDTDTDFKPIEGGAGVAVVGESGLREGYARYVQDLLQRGSGLLARRNAIDPKTGEPLFTGPQFGTTYGTDTSKTLSDLQTRRESMTADAKSYTPFKYSFAPKPAAAGGVMSLVDRYQTGGDVSSGATTGTQGNQALTSTYTAPTDIYKGPGDAGITAGTATFDTTARDRLMNPYMSGVVDPASREAKRQSQIQGMTNAAKFTQAGAFGGTRNILAGAELQRNLATQLGDIYGRGQKEAYDSAQRAFEAEQGRALTAGVESERARQAAGQQSLSSAATAADYEQRARQLQQQAEEAQARGDQFAADLALRQLQEANNAAAATRAFEYQQARDTYLDPFRELSYASSYLTGLPIKAGDTGISPLAESLVGSASGIALIKKALGLPDN